MERGGQQQRWRNFEDVESSYLVNGVKICTSICEIINILFQHAELSELMAVNGDVIYAGQLVLGVRSSGQRGR